MIDWVKRLDSENLVKVSTYHGKRPGMFSLLPRLRDTSTGLVTVINENGKPALQFWRSGFVSRAPLALASLEALVAPGEVGQGNRVDEVTPALLGVLTDAYREAVRTKPRKLDWSKVDAVVASLPKGHWASYGDVAEASGGTRAAAMAVGQYLARSTSISEDHVRRVLTEEGKVSPGWQGTIGGPEECPMWEELLLGAALR
jgi:alkylated DNA nucleotide flippase Atl1